MKVGTLKLLLDKYQNDAELFVVDREQNYSFDIVGMQDNYYNEKQYVDIIVDIDI